MERMLAYHTHPGYFPLLELRQANSASVHGRLKERKFQLDTAVFRYAAAFHLDGASIEE